uniref:Large ribosomal subunit protein eL28 n=1 Tax=Arenicola marina TaxID=6344 RepID=A8UFG5_AREMA|nr:ribosomal protein rpl28 [Arenicola marina]
MTADVQWMIIRKNSCFLKKGKGAPTMSLEPNNLKNKNSFRYNGLIHKQTVGVEAAEDGKGVVLVTRKNAGFRNPGKNHTRVELKKGGSRRTLHTIRTVIRSNRYRKDLKMAALRRASAILRSQKPIVVRKARGKKKE